MSKMILAGATLAMLSMSAAAQPQYDSNLEKAAAAIVAEKIGDIRGGFDFDEQPEFVRPIDWYPTAWRSQGNPDPAPGIGAAPLRVAGNIAL